jgi:hypothetical protein
MPMTSRRTTGLTLAALTGAALLAGCSTTSHKTVAVGAETSTVAPEGKGWIDGPPPTGGSAAGGGGEASLAAGAVADATMARAPLAPGTSPAVRVGPVTAGSSDDNERFDDYLRYIATAPTTGLHPVDVAGRRVVRVKGTDGHAVLGARVRIGDGQAPLLDARTPADGRVLFFPKATPGAGAGPWPVVVESGATKTTATLKPDGGDLVVDLATAAADPTRLDVMFLLDATGSMGDELDRLTANMATTATKVADAAGPGAVVRFGLTAFRDEGDAFLTKTFDLTTAHKAFQAAIADVKAGGGGDTPEAVSAGLHEAILKPTWGGADVAKVIVLVGDAAPHADGRQQADYAADARTAAAKGIRLHAIASSGLDDAGEFSFRQMALLAAGKFVFLTYGADGGPGDATTHHVDKYAVKPLDELVATLLIEELHPGKAPQQ